MNIGVTEDTAYEKLIPPIKVFFRSTPPRHSLIFGYVAHSGIRNALLRACVKAEVKYFATHQPERHFFAKHLHENKGWTNKAIADKGVGNSAFSQRYIHQDERSSRPCHKPDFSFLIAAISVSSPSQKKNHSIFVRPSMSKGGVLGTILYTCKHM